MKHTTITVTPTRSGRPVQQPGFEGEGGNQRSPPLAFHRSWHFGAPFLYSSLQGRPVVAIEVGKFTGSQRRFEKGNTWQMR